MVNPNLTKQEKARQLRYKKPLVKDICVDSIKEFLWDAQEQCTDALYYFETGDETLLNALDGDEDDEQEFKMAFADLSAECDQMSNDLDDEYIPECFDEFFTAAYSPSMGAMLGFDDFEGDYYGLDTYEIEYAVNEAAEKILRMKKKDILNVAKRCIKIFVAYAGLRNRYDSLKAALDIIRDTNTAQLQMVEQINALHDRATAGNHSWEDVLNYDRLLDSLPQIEWLK